MAVALLHFKIVNFGERYSVAQLCCLSIQSFSQFIFAWLFYYYFNFVPDVDFFFFSFTEFCICQIHEKHSRISCCLKYIQVFLFIMFSYANSKVFRRFGLPLVCSMDHKHSVSSLLL